MVVMGKTDTQIKRDKVPSVAYLFIEGNQRDSILILSFLVHTPYHLDIHRLLVAYK